jgi:hypothetical protein
MKTLTTKDAAELVTFLSAWSKAEKIQKAMAWLASATGSELSVELGDGTEIRRKGDTYSARRPSTAGEVLGGKR